MMTTRMRVLDCGGVGELFLILKKCRLTVLKKNRGQTSNESKDCDAMSQGTVQKWNQL